MFFLNNKKDSRQSVGLFTLLVFSSFLAIFLGIFIIYESYPLVGSVYKNQKVLGIKHKRVKNVNKNIKFISRLAFISDIESVFKDWGEEKIIKVSYLPRSEVSLGELVLPPGSYKLYVLTEPTSVWYSCYLRLAGSESKSLEKIIKERIRSVTFGQNNVVYELKCNSRNKTNYPITIRLGIIRNFKE